MNMDESGPRAAMPYESLHPPCHTSSCRPVELQIADEARLTASVATTIEEVERLRPVWSAWPHGLDADVDYYLYKLANNPAVLSPYVITVYDQAVLQAMLLGLVRKQRVSARVAHVRIPGPKAELLEIANGGRLGRQSSAIDQLLISVLIKAIQSGDLDALCFKRLSLHSELFHQLCTKLNARVPKLYRCSVLPLAAPAGDPPSTFSGKTKRELRRKTRLLENAFPHKVSFKCFSCSSDIESGILDATKVLVTTWQYCSGFRFLNTPQIHDELEFFAKKGWLRIFVLYIDDLPCAFLIGQLYHGTFYCQHVGYDRNFAQFSVGSLLTAWAFENLAAAGVRRVDLGEGGHEHFRRMGGEMSEEASVDVYSHTLPGIRANMFFVVTEALRAGWRHTLSAFSTRTAA